RRRGSHSQLTNDPFRAANHGPLTVSSWLTKDFRKWRRPTRSCLWGAEKRTFNTRYCGQSRYYGTLRLEFALQFVEEAPVGAVRDDILRAGLDHSDFVQAQGVETQCVLGTCGAPAVVRQSLENFESKLIARLVALFRHVSRRALRILRADVRRFQDC